MNKYDLDMPLAVFGEERDFMWGEKLTPCPFGNEFYYPVALENGRMTGNARYIKGPDYRFDNDTFEARKKPGLFSKKKPIHATIIWFIKPSVAGIGFNVNQLQGKTRKDNTTVPLFATGSVYININNIYEDTMLSFIKSLGRTFKKDTPLLYKRDVASLARYDLMYNLGDLYSEKILTSGQVMFKSHIRNGRGNDNIVVLFDKVCEITEKLLRNKVGLHEPRDYALVTYSIIDRDFTNL